VYRLLLLIGILSLLSSCTSPNEETTTDRVDDQLHEAVSDYFDSEPDNIDTFRQVGDYTWLRVSFPPSTDYGFAGGGGVGVAQKQSDGTWRIIFMGNGFPSCSELNGEAFPLELDVQCVGNGALLRLPTREVAYP